MKIVLLFLTFLLTWQLNAQGKVSNNPESIGFAYGVAASRSKIFAQVEEHLKNADYDQIIEFLKSDIPSEVFIGTLICKKLVDKKEISLTDEQLEMLNKNFTSQLPIIIRSGCTCSMEVTIEGLLKGVDNCNFDHSLKQWLSELLSF